MTADPAPEDHLGVDLLVADILELVQPLARPDAKQLSTHEARHAADQLSWLEEAALQGVRARSLASQLGVCMQ